MGAKLLLYHCGEEKTKKIQTAVSVMGIAVESLDEGALGQKLGKLAGLEEFSEEQPSDWTGEVPETEVLIMCGFSKIQFDLLMNLFKRGKTPRVVLKAMLTDTNQNWMLGKLIGELEEEHAYMHRKRKAEPKSLHDEE